MPRRLRVFFKGLYRTLGDYGQFVLSGKAATLVYGQITSWVVGNRTFQQGQAQSFDISTTGPSNYTAGGIYGVDPSSSQLPSGLVLAPNGVIQDTGAAAATQSGVVFTYHEPGALPTLTLYNGTVTGSLPYMATVYPLEGTVPSGQIITSADDTTLRSSVLSTWPDNSAQVMVLAGNWTFGSQNTTGTVRLRPGVSTGPALTVANIQAVISNIAVNFGAGVQTLSNAQLGSPTRTWWANPQVVCARYVLPTGLGVLRAFIDIHAFANGRAFVEVTIENGSIDSSLTSPAAPADQTYTNATVSVNGTTIATVSSTWNSGGGLTNRLVHRRFRAWYCSTWVGGDPQIEVTHDTAHLQAHPIFFKSERATAYNFTSDVLGSFYGVAQPYSADVYTPWSFGRHRWAGMGQTAGDEAIGPFTGWEARYIQTGSRYCARASIQNSLCLLSFPINYRDVTTNFPPTFTQISGKRLGADGDGFWPREFNGGNGGYGNYEYYEWDWAHQPPSALVAFLCRPSPVFIEIAQKIAAFNGLSYYGDGIQVRGQVREMAWKFRNFGHSIFITPSAYAAGAETWRAPIIASFPLNISTFRQFESNTNASRLNLVAKYGPDELFYDEADSGVGFQAALWQQSWLGVELARLHSMKFLSGTTQTDLSAFTDYVLRYLVRMINECTNGEWRYMGSYQHNLGALSNGENVKILDPQIYANWSIARNAGKLDSAGGDVGPLRNYAGVEANLFSDWYTTLQQTDYTSQMFGALVAAAERDTPGIDAAWAKFTAVTNLTAFRDLAAYDARWNIWPRNK